jgi:hypothetical protein
MRFCANEFNLVFPIFGLVTVESLPSRIAKLKSTSPSSLYGSSFLLLVVQRIIVVIAAFMPENAILIHNELITAFMNTVSLHRLQQ